MSMFALTATILATLLVPFTLIVGAVVSLMQTTEDDEFTQHLSSTLPHGVKDELLQQWLDALCNAPTEPTLEVQP